MVKSSRLYIKCRQQKAFLGRSLWELLRDEQSLEQSARTDGALLGGNGSAADRSAAEEAADLILEEKQSGAAERVKGLENLARFLEWKLLRRGGASTTDNSTLEKTERTLEEMRTFPLMVGEADDGGEEFGGVDRKQRGRSRQRDGRSRSRSASQRRGVESGLNERLERAMRMHNVEQTKILRDMVFKKQREEQEAEKRRAEEVGAGSRETAGGGGTFWFAPFSARHVHLVHCSLLSRGCTPWTKVGRSSTPWTLDKRWLPLVAAGPASILRPVQSVVTYCTSGR